MIINGVIDLKHRVFVTRKLPEEGMALLKETCHVEVNPYDRILTKEEIIEGLKDKDGLLCLLTDKIDPEVICSNPGLKAIANYAAGYNNIDIKTASERHIPVTNTPDVLTDSTADLTWSLILSVPRRIVEGDKLCREKKFRGWGPMFMLGSDIYGKTLGIIGMGRIGLAVAARAQGFNMKILYHSRKRMIEEEKKLNMTFVSFDELLRESDIITLHVPLNSETKHLIGSKEFCIMKRTSYLINTSRGEVVDEEALVKALKNGEIMGAGLDVYEKEPAITEELIGLENVILLPHIGSATVETRTRMAVMAVENLLTALNGNIPPNIVNKEIFNKI